MEIVHNIVRGKIMYERHVPFKKEIVYIHTIHVVYFCVYKIEKKSVFLANLISVDLFIISRYCSCK